MPDVYIKTPNLDDIFERWKQSTYKKNKKKLEKQFKTKGAVFSLDAISAAEYVKDTMKEAAIYFAIQKSIAPAKGKEEDLVEVKKLSKVQFYSFKDSDKVNKDNWKGDDKVPIFESITAVSCKDCGGKGFVEDKCKGCKGTGTIEEKWKVLVGEDQNKDKRKFSFPCGECYGTGKARDYCRTCYGHKNLYKYEIRPVPFQTVVTGIPVLHSSAQTKYEKEIEQDLHKLIEKVEGIRFDNFKDLENKAEASLGYWNKKIKKTIGAAGSDYKDYDKNDDTKIITKIYLFPMIQLFCETKKGKGFEIYSLGSEKEFMIYSNF
ncbi:MAG: hypothetical protein GF353_03115 [Candidatus Lokiarchaeota archaeon]|nr:hypothetical protein [Candidatus Lokiarchaeota archaeon]